MACRPTRAPSTRGALTEGRRVRGWQPQRRLQLLEEDGAIVACRRQGRRQLRLAEDMRQRVEGELSEEEPAPRMLAVDTSRTSRALWEVSLWRAVAHLANHPMT